MKKYLPLLLPAGFLLLDDAWPQDPKKKIPTLSAKEKTSLANACKDYFAAKSEDDRSKAMQQIADLERGKQITKGELITFSNYLFQLAKQGTRHDGKPIWYYRHPEGNGKVLVDNISQGNKVGLFIGLHGGGKGLGDSEEIKRLFDGGGVPGCTCVWPTVIKSDSDTGWNTEREVDYVLDLIKIMKRTYNIDTNRIYLAGHSMGGFGTWHIGTNNADEFAAIAPMAGALFGGTVVNLKNTPIWFYHSIDDLQVGAGQDQTAAIRLKEYKDKYGPYQFVWKEYNNNGHHRPPDGVAPIFKWMGQQTRNPYPRFVIWEPQKKTRKLFYWLRMDDPDGRVEAKIDDKENKITLGGSFKGLSIMLNDRVMRLGKTITVVKEGKEVFKGEPAYSYAVLVESIHAKNDPELFFYAKISVPDE